MQLAICIPGRAASVRTGKTTLGEVSKCQESEHRLRPKAIHLKLIMAHLAAFLNINVRETRLRLL